MDQDCGQGAERREWILGTFWRKNGQDYFSPKSLFWAFLPSNQAPISPGYKRLLSPFSVSGTGFCIQELDHRV